MLADGEVNVVQSTNVAQRVEVVLKLANDDELNSEFAQTPICPKDNKGSSTHPLLAKLRILDADKNALKEYCDGILSTQIEK